MAGWGRMAAMHWGRLWMIRVAMVMLIAAVVVGWIAVGRAAEATQRALGQSDRTLAEAEQVATSAAAIADGVTAFANTLSSTMLDTSTALAATKRVSENVRGTVDVLARFSGKVEDLTASLEQAESSLDSVIADLTSGRGQVIEALPALREAADALGRVPGSLTEGRVELRSSIAAIDDQVGLWRTALVAGGAVLALVLWVLQSLVARDAGGSIMPAAPAPAQP